MTRFTLMMAVVAMFSYGPLLAGGVEVEEGTAKFTVVEHAGGTHIHPHGFVGKNGKMMKHDHKKTLFSFGPFTLFSLGSLKDKVKKAGHKVHEVGSKVVHSDVTKDLAKSAGHKAMDKVGEAIASGAAKEVIKGAAGAAMGLMIK